MATIQREIAIKASPAQVRDAWDDFSHWILTGGRKLSCDEFACVNAVDAGNVQFAPFDGAGTRVVFRLDVPAGEPGPTFRELERHVDHDLIVFKDYMERGGLAAGKPTSDEDATLKHDAGVKGDKPRHVRLSTEPDTTFWRSHFPT